MVSKVLWLSLAGACGTVSRYALCELSRKVAPLHVHLGTFAVNIIGSFLFGAVYALAQRKFSVSPQFQLVMLTGFMGSFTTFSTFAFDTANLLRSAQWTTAAGNALGQVVIGVLAMAAGVMLVRSF